MRLTKTEKTILAEARRIKRRGRLNESGPYWYGKGRYQKEADQLADLLPVSGPTDSLKGEIWRAANKIAYQWYNNNWGNGNEWASAAQFLIDHVPLPPHIKSILYRHGLGVPAGRDFEPEITEMLDIVIEYLRKVDPNEPLPHDMLETEIDEYQFEEPDEEELDDLFW